MMYKHSLRLRLKFWGKVRTYSKRGRKLGFPTANISLHKNIPEGIYISTTKLGGKEYKQSLKKLRFFKSITFIGAAKTFGEKKFHAETYILDFGKNIYGKWVSIKLIKKIRINKKFNSAQELIEQMKKDEKETRKYFQLN